jgi:ProP effector
MSSAELARIHQTIALLAQRWPKCFAVLDRRRPLKVGIDRDIAAAAPDIEPADLTNALRYYVSNIGYLNACVVGAPRVGLEGEVCGSISERDAQHAALLFAKALERRPSRRQAKPTRSNEMVTSPAPSPSPPAPKRDGLAELRAAAARRKQQEQQA